MSLTRNVQQVGGASAMADTIREMQRLRGEGCAAVLTEDDVVMAVSEGVTRETERERERKAHV